MRHLWFKSKIIIFCLVIYGNLLTANEIEEVEECNRTFNYRIVLVGKILNFVEDLLCQIENEIDDNKNLRAKFELIFFDIDLAKRLLEVENE